MLNAEPLPVNDSNNPHASAFLRFTQKSLIKFIS